LLEQKRLANEKAFQQRQREKHNLAIKLRAAGNTCIASINEQHYKRSALDIRKQLFKIMEHTTGSDIPPTNFTGADLTGAKLGEVSLDVVILCNTTMPDGAINNTSCKN
jgi:hypothetical protein